jgi:hypothetical protein
MAKEKYISLKEAASLSGYTPDYVGQLIRRGKLPGKQVFSHVAWMTTEDALQEYMENNRKGPAPQLNWTDKAISVIDIDTFYKVFLGAIIALVAMFILFLIYIVSVSIDRHIEKSYQQKVQQL